MFCASGGMATIVAGPEPHVWYARLTPPTRAYRTAAGTDTTVIETLLPDAGHQTS